MRIPLLRSLLVLGAVGYFAYCGAQAEAATARSISYSMDYTQAGAGAGTARSDDSLYSMTGLVTVDGVKQSRTQGGGYSIEPLYDAPGTPRATVQYWMLYK